jgi:hypothetical protein
MGHSCGLGYPGRGRRPDRRECFSGHHFDVTLFVLCDRVLLTFIDPNFKRFVKMYIIFFSKIENSVPGGSATAVV